ncbi:MAG: ubiquinone/menaquinone biosynthesis methyltransferase [Thermodesulfobacteriota bacterium]
MDRSTFIRRMFQEIAFSYDFQNSFLSLRRDVHWRKVLAQSIRQDEGTVVLDAATGTAEVAIEICRWRPGTRVVGVDFSPRMLVIGRKKLRARCLEDRVALATGDARRTPFKGASFGGVTMAFGLRNIDDRMQVLKEFRRILRPGGQLLIMEFGYPDNPLLRILYRLYFDHILPPVGNFLSRTSYAYTYLRESVQAFPKPEAFLEEIGEAGFSQPAVRKLTFGIARIYSGIKADTEGIS